MDKEGAWGQGCKRDFGNHTGRGEGLAGDDRCGIANGAMMELNHFFGCLFYVKSITVKHDFLP